MRHMTVNFATFPSYFEVETEEQEEDLQDFIKYLPLDYIIIYFFEFIHPFVVTLNT